MNARPNIVLVHGEPDLHLRRGQGPGQATGNGIEGAWHLIKV